MKTNGSGRRADNTESGDTSANTTMLALSIQQPWAWAILFAGKDVENRKWYTSYRGRFLIHASKNIDYDGRFFIDNLGINVPTGFQTGGIVGIAEIYDCVMFSKSKWFFGPYGFLIRNQTPITFRSLPGKLKFFECF